MVRWTRPHVCNCTSGNLEIPARCFASPRNDRSSRRQDRAFDFAKADAIAVALAPAAHDKGIAIFKKRPDDAARQLDRLGAVPAYFQKAAALVLLRAADGARPQEIADIHGAA